MAEARFRMSGYADLGASPIGQTHAQFGMVSSVVNKLGCGAAHQNNQRADL